jgi:hypothetical protein
MTFNNKILGVEQQIVDEFDVFLSHNSRDKPVVEEIGKWLGGRGLRVWLDKWQLRPGVPWQEGLEAGVQASQAVAVLVGADGLAAWQEPEMRAFIARSKREQIPVIPVLLPDCPDSPQLTLFLEAFTWVDLRQGLTEDGLARLLWGITGEKPQKTETVASASGANRERPAAEGGRPGRIAGSSAGTGRVRWNWGVGLSILGILGTLGVWFWPSLFAPSPRPALYAVRVQVLDPQGHPVAESKIRTSAGSEPHLLPDGWWQVEIPAAKVPAGGRVSLWAEHTDWEDNQALLRLGADPNPQLEIRLKEPETWLRGRVVDSTDGALSGARVSRQDGPSGVAITDARGRFELKVPVPRETRVRVRAERAGSPPVDGFCYAGRDSCSIVLEQR